MPDIQGRHRDVTNRWRQQRPGPARLRAGPAVGGPRRRGPNHSPDNIYIHFPGHDTLMFIDVVNAGWVPIYNLNLSEDVSYVAWYGSG